MTFYLTRFFHNNKDPQALKPLFYISPYGAEPFRTQAMGVLSRVSRKDPRTFFASLSLLANSDRLLFIRNFTAYLHQRDLADEFLRACKKPFRNLDMGYEHYDVAMSVWRAVKDVRY